MGSDKDTDRAVWYLAATPATVSQWLVRLWRTNAVIDLVVLVTAFLLPSGTSPLRRLAPVIAATALISVERASRRSRSQSTSRFLTAAHLSPAGRTADRIARTERGAVRPVQRDPVAEGH
jgi:hypothetical protein